MSRDWGKDANMSSPEFVSVVFNGALALAGILLVFMGFIYSQAESFPAGTDRRISQRYKVVAKLGLIPFALAIVLAGVTFSGLIALPDSVRHTAIILFWIELGLLLVYGCVSVLFYL